MPRITFVYCRIEAIKVMWWCYVEDVIWPLGDTNFIFECWKYLSRVSSLSVAHSWEILSALKDKICIPKWPRNIQPSSPTVKILFLSFTCEDIGVAMVTNMISQLQESFPLYYSLLLSLFLLYNFLSKFHNIFVTGILE